MARTESTTVVGQGWPLFLACLDLDQDTGDAVPVYVDRVIGWAAEDNLGEVEYRPVIARTSPVGTAPIALVPGDDSEAPHWIYGLGETAEAAAETAWLAKARRVGDAPVRPHPYGPVHEPVAGPAPTVGDRDGLS
jgi:hypothetical protein